MNIRHGQVHAWDSTERNWVPADLGLGTIPTTFYANSYDDKIVTVPAPTGAPTLTAVTHALLPALVDGSTYAFKCSYLGWTGETLLSPAASAVCANGQLFGVLPNAPLGTRAPAARIYISKDGGAYHLADSPSGTGPAKVVGFAAPTWGAHILGYNASGDAPPGSNTAADQDGTAIADPSVAPTLITLAGVAAGTYYGAFSWVCEDGTETALSPISSSVTVSSGPTTIKFVLPQSAPTGAVAVNLYLGTSASTGAMKLQISHNPLNYVTTAIHTFNSSGAAHSTGASQSTISGFQQAYDAALEAQGGTVVAAVDAGSKVPIIFRQKNSSGTAVVGIKILGTGVSGSGAVGRSSLSYTGSLSGISFVIMGGTAMTITGIDFLDPNNKVRQGLAFSDAYGGGAFQSKYSECGFYAGYSGGYGVMVANESRGSSNHSASEQYFEKVTFYGNAWAGSIRSNQTTNFHFDKGCNFSSGGNSSSANSGLLHFGAVAAPITIAKSSFTTNGQFVFYLGFSFVPSDTGSFPGFDISDCFGGESANANCICFVDGMSGGFGETTPIVFRNNAIIIPSHPSYFAYVGQSANITVIGNAPAGNVFLNHADARFINLGNWQGYFKGLAPTFPPTGGSDPAFRNSPLILGNESNQLSYLATNTAGDLVLSPYSNVFQLPSTSVLNFNAGDVLLTHSSNKLTLSGGNFAVPDDAYDATSWNGNFDVPTKNAIRDKIESLSLGGGDMLKSDNLSGLTNYATARSNLGLGTLATQNGTFSGTSSGTNTGDQTITLTGDVTGSGTGSFATAIGASKVTNAMLAGSIAYSKLSLTGAILNADLAGSIAPTKLLVNSDFAFTANQSISNSAPTFTLTDTTASAKSLTIKVDANVADLREAAGASGSLLALDLANNRLGIGTASPAQALHVQGTSSVKVQIDASTNTGFSQLLFTENSGAGGLIEFMNSNFGASTRRNNLEIYNQTATGSITFHVNNSTTPSVMYLTTGNVKVAGSATRGTTEGTNHLDIFDGTAPVGTLSNGISLYSTSGELRVMDSAGNATLLSPHDSEGNWIHDEINFKGRRLRVDMERLLKAVDQLLGGGFIEEYLLP